MEIESATSRGSVRETNEDSHWHNAYCAVICDGMGGHQAGEVASQLAVETVQAHTFAFSDLPSELEALIQDAHTRIKTTAARNAQYNGMGTTMTMAVFPPPLPSRAVYVGHVGDSRAYLMRDQRLVRLTHDHSVTGELVRNGSLQPEEAQYHPQKHMLTQALGSGSVDVDVQRHPIRPGDILLLCTDGLTAVLSDAEVLSVLENTPPSAAAETLVQEADRRGGPDNTTVIVVHVPEHSGSNFVANRSRKGEYHDRSGSSQPV